MDHAQEAHFWSKFLAFIFMLYFALYGLGRMQQGRDNEKIRQDIRTLRDEASHSAYVIMGELHDIRQVQKGEAPEILEPVTPSKTIHSTPYPDGRCCLEGR